MTRPVAAPSRERLSLRWRIVTVLLAVSLLPLALMGVGAWVVFGRLLEGKAVELQRRVVQSHAESIEVHLATQRELLRLVADHHSRRQLSDEATLRELLSALNRASGSSFVDLGVIGPEGEHLAYVGPYDLASRNYRDAEWFRQVVASGVFISDVFLGFRQVPHFVIAIRESDDEGPWVLRATFNSEAFDALVRTGVLGETGEAYIVNREGLYQTSPRLGSLLDRAPLETVEPHSGVRDRRVKVAGTERIVVTSWINSGRWQLVVQQDAAEVRAPVRRAVATGAVVISLAVLLVVLTTMGATRHLQRQIDRADQQREEMSRAFMRSAKLASVGELATGLAHEINNPLAIISAEQTNLADLIALAPLEPALSGELRESSERIRAQVERCAGITGKLLQFSHRLESAVQPTDLSPRLQDIAALLHRQASVRNVDILLDVEEDLPPVLADPVELEQVLVNLITNSFHAMPAGGTIRLVAQAGDGEVRLDVTDDGQGMEAAVLERAFEPFFTTKPVGQGTGLGLSVCYGLVHSWGSRIEASSELGRGTTIRIRFPRREG